MPDVYLHVPKSDIDDVTDCGMKLSEYSTSTISVNGTSYDCMCGYLHPADAKFDERDGEMVCVRAEVKEQYCYIGDADLHVIARRSGGVLEKYQQSIVPICEYKLGTYRNPECYVTCTIIGDSIYDVQNGDSAPLLYNSSEDLYYECLETFLKDECGIEQKDILACFFEYLRYQGIFRVESANGNCNIFYSNKMEKCFALDKADCDAILEKLACLDLMNS